MRILLLGGTRFLGKHAALIARERGHAVTLFNRGKSGTPDSRFETITGDRHSDLGRLGTRTWDAILDTNAFHPASVRIAAHDLRERTDAYLMVSSASVYDLHTPLIDTHSAFLPALSEQEMAAIDPGAPPEPELYGRLKAECENAAIAEFGAKRTLITRPGLIVGPDDPTDRFTYWPLRADAGGTMLAPDGPGHVVQFIDVRDLATWMVHALEIGLRGAFNVTGPRNTNTFGQIVAAASKAAPAAPEVVWLDEEFLLAEAVGPWMELPLWIPRSDAATAGIVNVAVDQAIAAGLKFRPVATTLGDTLAWARQHKDLAKLAAGLSAEREATLIEKWRARAAGLPPG